MIRAVITDIEGTTTPIDFVHKVLFPYSTKHLDSWLAHNENDVYLLKLSNQWQGTDMSCSEILHSWIAEDSKNEILKSIQGKIWRDGYQRKELVSQIYNDVPIALELWKTSDIRLGVYSSGSVEAQKLLFQYSDKGDLTPYFSEYFDTQTGAKREKSSYLHIQKTLNIDPEDILFLSDIEQELDAATEAGFKTCHIQREGNIGGSTHIQAKNFDEVTTLFFPFLKL